MKLDSPVVASSKTYRKVNKKLAQIARVRLKHGPRPSEDFEELTEHLKNWSKVRALRYYKRALQRGFIEACDAVLDGRLVLRDGELHCRPKRIVIARKFRFSDGSRERRTFEFAAKDLEFS